MQKTPAMNNKLYVGNLAFEALEIDIQDLFAQAGTVTDATLMMDRATGQSRGFAFVTMSTPAEAQEAIKRFNGQDLHGRALTVNEAKPREDRGGGGGGPRSGGNSGQRRY
jgi:RNA recognition motif-containing protein